MGDKGTTKTEIDEVMFEAGLSAWDAMDSSTHERIKNEVENIYNDEQVKEIDDIFEKIKLPKEIVLIAFTKLIEEGRIVEIDVGLPDILSIVRKLSNDNEKIQSRLLSLAEGAKIQKDVSVKILEELKAIKKIIEKVDIMGEIKKSIEGEKHD